MIAPQSQPPVVNEPGHALSHVPVTNVSVTNVPMPNAHMPNTLMPGRNWLGNSDPIAWVWLVGSSVCLALAGIMSVGDERRVHLGWWSQPLPELCWMYTRFHIDCPGCGLTRTFIHMMHGQWGSAWHTNAVGILVFVFVCIQIPWGLAQVVFKKRNQFTEAWGLFNDWCVAGLLIALLVQWAVQAVVRLGW